MADQETNELDPQTAYAHVVGTVYSPVFFRKLAQDYGIEPRTQDEAEKLLALAGQLKIAQANGTYQPEPAEKEAAEASFLDNALASAHELTQSAQPEASQISEADVKTAADTLMQDEVLVNCVATVQAALAAQAE